MAKLALMLLASCALSGCGAAERIANIGKAPDMSEIKNPQLQPDYKPVSLPMPAPKYASSQPNSLWSANRTTFFKDQRAADVGDIMTVVIEIADKAELDNETERKRESGESLEAPNLLGYESKLHDVLPEAVDPSSLADVTSDSDHKGTGTIDREEKVKVKLAAIITQVLPNGNFVIHGSQEVLVNFEKRVLAVDGVVRPEDIAVGNTINYDQIAEARIVYGGQGQLTDVQQPRYGQQLYDVLMPF
jgi:flagellar L-ring protein precursor FlgH